jgi:hypothetical protein
MHHLAARGLRIGAVALLAAVVTCGIWRAGAAETGKRDPNRSRYTAARSPGPATPPLSLKQPAGTGAMRYYGGPKSVMWRAPATN